jgi:hypothetical protein
LTRRHAKTPVYEYSPQFHAAVVQKMKARLHKFYAVGAKEFGLSPACGEENNDRSVSAGERER